MGAVKDKFRQISSRLDWKKQGGLIPAIIQDSETGQVLMLGYMNEEALARTLETGKVWFFSRSRDRLWMKGEKSSNTLEIVDIQPDCDFDTLLVSANPAGPTCHTGEVSCFSTVIPAPVVIPAKAGIQSTLASLFALLTSRAQSLPENSYTTTLLKAGTDKICAKIAEESGEVIKAAAKETRKRLTEESVDLIYHLFVLLVSRKITWKELLEEVEKRRK